MPSRRIHNPRQGDTATFLETASETNGAYSLIEVVVDGGADGAPPHFHTEFDEEIVAVEGPLTVTVAGKTMVLQPGERVVVPKGVVHAWTNTAADPATFHARLTPGHTGFENFLRAAYGLAEQGRLNEAGIPKDVATLAVLLRWGDTNVPGVLALLNPLFRWLAKRGERSGLGDRLRREFECEMGATVPAATASGMGPC